MSLDLTVLSPSGHSQVVLNSSLKYELDLEGHIALSDALKVMLLCMEEAATLRDPALRSAYINNISEGSRGLMGALSEMLKHYRAHDETPDSEVVEKLIAEVNESLRRRDQDDEQEL